MLSPVAVQRAAEPLSPDCAPDADKLLEMMAALDAASLDRVMEGLSLLRQTAAPPAPPPRVHRPSARVAGAVAHLLSAEAGGLLAAGHPTVELFDLDRFTGLARSLQAAMPSFRHALAIKANPSSGVLRAALSLGLGAECASPVEMEHARACGFEGRAVVYDSPCKTVEQLRSAAEHGHYVNLDSFVEIERLAALAPTLDLTTTAEQQFGVRINPEVGAGSIASTSTAAADSKFGVKLSDGGRERLLACYAAQPWLQGVHCHVGSQGCGMELLVAGARAAVDFALEVNAAVGRAQVTVVDIGGGLSVSYDGEDDSPTFAAYAALLRERVPELFSGQFDVITEFGRSLLCKCGVTATLVESVKEGTAIVHVGADMFMRVAYQPEAWSLRLSVFTRDGAESAAEPAPQTVAGPLCFSGDVLARGRLLPRIAEGDVVVIHDTGAYTRCMYSRYNSRRAPPVLGFRVAEDGTYATEQLTAGETAEDVMRFWR